ncbi:hypothetical protein QE109_10860 [Fusibacter bizertensis]|uniref:Uncharacterized protein n=1 Tax=Fusibacter bizertensis TaxID=1488331 RepID=A0ABT6NE29_9FIRM|nr:hypothetical protein [Fusibacter bizertensis]MDH8678651.1 hypothetical protein [Fusibacter bizertensis]
MEKIKIKFNAVKNHLSSYKTYPDGSNVEEDCIRKDKWLYQANKTDAIYNISIKTAGERYEYPSKRFCELEYEFFKTLWEVTSNEK